MENVDNKNVEQSYEGAQAGRRSVLRLAAVAGAAAVVATAVDQSSAQATNGLPVVLGVANNAATLPTTVADTGTSAHGPALAGYRSPTDGATASFAQDCGVLGQSDFEGKAGVIGWSGPGGPGVSGVSDTYYGTFGRSTSGAGVSGEIDVDGTGVGGRFAGGRAQLLLVPGTTAGAPTLQEHFMGEVYLDSLGVLFLCTARGTPGTWRNLSAPPTAPSLNFVVPARVYDSREELPSKGALSSGQSRTVSVADGRALSGGAVTIADLVPSGATGIAYTLTIVNTVGQGFLTVNPGTNTSVTSSAVNWSSGGLTVASGSVVGVDANRQITVIAGGGGSTDFLIDIVGYYR
jgi:hypothetical protein